MKKIFLFIFLLLFLSSAVFAGKLDEKEAKLKKTREYIKYLDKKIVQMRNARKINKLAELKDIKRTVLARAKTLQAEIKTLKK